TAINRRCLAAPGHDDLQAMIRTRRCASQILARFCSVSTFPHRHPERTREGSRNTETIGFQRLSVPEIPREYTRDDDSVRVELEQLFLYLARMYGRYTFFLSKSVVNDWTVEPSHAVTVAFLVLLQ